MSSSTQPSLLLMLFLLATTASLVSAQCLSNPDLENQFAELNSGSSLPVEGSCCQLDVCGIPCPQPIPAPHKGFGVVVGAFIGLSFVIGLSTYYCVKGKTENFFVAGRSLPVWILAFTLGAQSVDVNSILGNSDLAYKYHFFDGVCIPVGIGLALLLNSIFFAHKIHEDNVLTVPDVYAKRYGRVVEVLVSFTTIVSFLFLLGGNFLGLGSLINYLWGIDRGAAIWIASGIIWTYTVSGGLFSVAYTDVLQGIIGWVGCFAAPVYLITQGAYQAPPPSIGFPSYIYPDSFGDGGVCDMYQGIPCSVNATNCCYNTDLWCPSDDNCTADNGAYPIGDERIFPKQMLDPAALSPFPNAIAFNWATVIILAFGSLSGLDFQARCMAAKTGRGARIACVLGGFITFLIGIPISFVGPIMRSQLYLTIAFTEGVVAASMSTADGSILALGTVFSNNVVRQFDGIWPNIVRDDNLLLAARISTVPFTLIATFIAAYYNSDHSAGPGYLLIVGFDIVLATTIAPLFGAYYCKNPSPSAALLSVLAGGISRIVMEFTVPKDGFLLLPFGIDEFLNVGAAASFELPPFMDSASVWDPNVETCTQERFSDFTGVDSLSAFALGVIVFVAVQWLENGVMGGRPLFTFPGGTPYDKVANETIPLEKKIDKEDVMAVEEPDSTKTMIVVEPDSTKTNDESGEEVVA